MSPENTAEYLGLPSIEALSKRVLRLQVPVYRISDRVFRYRAAELDQAFARKPLTVVGDRRSIGIDACLPEGKEVAI